MSDDERLRHERYCAGIEAEVACLVGLVRAADPAMPVPSCPGWSVATLVRHHGTTHRWVEHMVRRRVGERVWSRDVPLHLPREEGAFPAWLAGSAAASVLTLRMADPAAPMWTQGVDGRVRFWARRLLFEAVVHRADAELALGARPSVDAGTAADGIDEFLENLPSPPGVPGRDGAELLLCEDGPAGGRWRIKLGGDGFSWERAAGAVGTGGDGGGGGAVAVRGAAGDLLLLLYGRLSPEERAFTVEGDGELLGGWLRGIAF